MIRYIQNKTENTKHMELIEMMYEEFKRLTGKNVSYEDFEKFEKMYMAGDMDKFEFCEFIKGAVKEQRNQKPKFYGYIRTSRNWRGEMSVNIATGKTELRNLEEYDGEIPFGARWFSAFEVERGEVVVRSYKVA